MNIGFWGIGFNFGSGFSSSGGFGGSSRSSGSGFGSFSGGGKKPKKTKKTKQLDSAKAFGKIFVGFVSFLFLVVVSFVSGYFGSLLNDYLKKSENGIVNEDYSPSTKIDFTGSSGVEAVVAKALPSIVGVVSCSPNEQSRGDLFDKFPFSFLTPFPFMSSSLPRFKTIEKDIKFKFPKNSVIGFGSGFFVKVDGERYVLTNYHVIEKFVESELKNSANGYGAYVVFKNNTSNLKSSKIVGYDADLDVAVLKVDCDTSKIPCLEFADMKNVKVGARAIAIGNPFTLESYSITCGIVSSFRKIQKENGAIWPVVQTDAAINQGSSGGPLINEECKVIGMNTARPANSRAEGTSLATDGGVLQKTVLGICKDGTRNNPSNQPSLGIQVIADNTLLASFGVVIGYVAKDSPAEKAGLREFDVIASIDDKRVSNIEEWQSELRKKKIGSEVSLVIIRKGQNMNVKVVVGTGKE